MANCKRVTYSKNGCFCKEPQHKPVCGRVCNTPPTLAEEVFEMGVGDLFLQQCNGVDVSSKAVLMLLLLSHRACTNLHSVCVCECTKHWAPAAGGVIVSAAPRC